MTPPTYTVEAVTDTVHNGKASNHEQEIEQEIRQGKSESEEQAGRDIQVLAAHLNRVRSIRVAGRSELHGLIAL